MSETLPNIRIKIQNPLTVTPNDFQVKTELLTAYSRFTSFVKISRQPPGWVPLKMYSENAEIVAIVTLLRRFITFDASILQPDHV
jgi:hypothetical protein